MNDGPEVHIEMPTGTAVLRPDAWHAERDDGFVTLLWDEDRGAPGVGGKMAIGRSRVLYIAEGDVEKPTVALGGGE